VWANDGGAVEERVDRAGRSEEAVGGRAAADWGRAVQQLNLGEAAAGAAVDQVGVAVAVEVPIRDDLEALIERVVLDGAAADHGAAADELDFSDAVGRPLPHKVGLAVAVEVAMRDDVEIGPEGVVGQGEVDGAGAGDRLNVDGAGRGVVIDQIGGAVADEIAVGDDPKARAGRLSLRRPPPYRPYMTIYNRFNRWSRQGLWFAIFEACHSGIYGLAAIDSTRIKAHRSAAGGKGGFRASARHLARRADQQAARRHRRDGTAATDPADRRQCLRCGDRAGAPRRPRAVPTACRRPRLRQQCHPPADRRARRRGRHPAQLLARAPNPLPPHRLPPAKPRRAAVVSPQGLAPYRDPIRQARVQLPRQRLSHRHPYLVDQLSPDPSLAIL
jgi:hypothetical protein